MTWDELRQEAFGEVKLLPKDFYEMEREEYWLLHRGFTNGREYVQQVIRNAVVLMISPWCKNPPSPYHLWPLPGDRKMRDRLENLNKNKKIEISEQTRERLRKLKQRDN